MPSDPYAAIRTYDVDAMRASDGSQVGDMIVGIVDATGSQAVTGIQKLAQRALLELLTRKGSMLLLPTRGSSLLDSISRGGVRTEADVYQAFAFASTDVLRNLAADTATADPADEKLRSFELTGASVLPGYIQLNVRIESEAGVGFVMPAVVPTSP